MRIQLGRSLLALGALFVGGAVDATQGNSPPPPFLTDNDTGARWSDDEMVKALEKYVGRLVRKDEFSGTILLAKNGDPLFKKAYGLASKRFDVKNEIDTKFNLGSMNKMFTGIAICQLAEKGKLSFDDLVRTHLPDYPNREIADQVTIHHLLTHTSGMGSYWNQKFQETWPTLRTVKDLLPLFVDDPLSFDPGTRFGYSNSGPIVLGLIIEKITGKTYYDYVREHICEPAGMIHTDCYEMDRPVPNLAIGYTRTSLDGHRSNRKSPRRNNLFLHTVKGGPAGGGFSTAEDLLLFSKALMNHKILAPESTKILTTGKVSMGSPEMQYAYLFGDHLEKGHRFFGHNGGAPGINAEFSVYPDLGYTVVVLSNYDEAASTVARFIRNMIHERPVAESMMKRKKES